MKIKNMVGIVLGCLILVITLPSVGALTSSRDNVTFDFNFPEAPERVVRSIETPGYFSQVIDENGNILGPNMDVNIREGYRFIGWFSREYEIIREVRFHIDGKGVAGESYIAVPAIYRNGRFWIDENSEEWKQVLSIGNIYADDAPNEMKGSDAPIEEVGYVGNRYAAHFWGWFESDNLDPRINGRNEGPYPIALVNGEPTRFRPNIGSTLRQVHPGCTGEGYTISSTCSATEPIYGYGEDEGLDLNALLTNGITDNNFDEGIMNIFGIWIRWGDVNDAGITFSQDSIILHNYLVFIAWVLAGFDMPSVPLHHGAADVALRGYVFSDSAARLEAFLMDLTLVLAELPVDNPTRLGTRTEHVAPSMEQRDLLIGTSHLSTEDSGLMNEVVHTTPFDQSSPRVLYARWEALDGGEDDPSVQTSDGTLFIPYILLIMGSGIILKSKLKKEISV